MLAAATQDGAKRAGAVRRGQARRAGGQARKVAAGGGETRKGKEQRGSRARCWAYIGRTKTERREEREAEAHEPEDRGRTRSK